MLIGITGHKNSGKDTVGKILTAEHGFVRFGFADPLKEMALAIDPYVLDFDDSPCRLGELVARYGWEYAKGLDTVREFLQRLGTEGVRDHLGENIWVDATMQRVDSMFKAGFDVVVTDVRFPNEAAAIRRRGGAIWKLHRLHTQGLRFVAAVPPASTTNTHTSETSVDDITADRDIYNYFGPAGRVQLADSVAYALGGGPTWPV